MFLTAKVNRPKAMAVKTNEIATLVAVDRLTLRFSSFENTKVMTGPAIIHHKGFIDMAASGAIGMKPNKSPRMVLIVTIVIDVII